MTRYRGIATNGAGTFYILAASSEAHVLQLLLLLLLMLLLLVLLVLLPVLEARSASSAALVVLEPTGQLRRLLARVALAPGVAVPLAHLLVEDVQVAHRVQDVMASDRLARDSGARRRLLALDCLLYTSPSPRDRTRSRMPSSA